MSSLTERQRAVMLFIQREIATKGEAPTLEQIAEACGISGGRSKAHYYISALCSAGYLARDNKRHRSLRVVRPVSDDRFEEAARDACKALQCVPSKANIQLAREAIMRRLMPEAA